MLTEKLLLLSELNFYHGFVFLQDKRVVNDWKLPRGRKTSEGSDGHGGPNDSHSPPRRKGPGRGGRGGQRGGGGIGGGRGGGDRQERREREPRTPREGEHGESGGPGRRGGRRGKGGEGLGGGQGGGTPGGIDRKSKVCALEFLS